MLVAGARVTGNAVVAALTRIGARPTVSDVNHEELARVAALGAMTAHDLREPPPGTDLVVTVPGFRPDAPLLLACAAAGLPVCGDVELAWRCDVEEVFGPRRRWLAVTGTNGKTTTTTMLEKILLADGRHAVACGNIGRTVLEALSDPTGFTDLAVELSSFQLHWQRSVSAVASACLNVAPDHLDWHGSFEEYLRAKGRIYQHTHIACVYNVADPLTEQLVMEAEVVEGCRAIGFTLGVPAPSMLGLVDEVLADRAFVEQRQNSAAELGTLHDLQGDAPSLAPHYVANALAAAALARAYGVGPLSVRDGLRTFRQGPHRIADVATVDGVRFVNDSKATNPHAALASLRSFERVVWVAGGLLKGADEQQLGDLVTAVSDRLRGVVLIGADRARLADALARHAPEVPVVDLEPPQTGPMAALDVMDLVVERAVSLAQDGDVVLLAPAAASMDMFANYAARGDAFEAAVRRYAESH